MFTGILWRFLILETFVLGALCDWRCYSVHPQKKYCTSDLVLKLKIIEQIRGTKYIYRTKLLKVFRGDREQLNITENQYVDLETAEGLDLNIYLIFVRFNNGRIYADSCKGMMVWAPEDTFYTNALNNLYKSGCDCIDEIGYYTPDKICYWNFSYMKNVDKNCKWTENDYFKRCQEAVHSHGK